MQNPLKADLKSYCFQVPTLRGLFYIPMNRGILSGFFIDVYTYICYCCNRIHLNTIAEWDE